MKIIKTIIFILPIIFGIVPQFDGFDYHYDLSVSYEN